MDDLPKPKGFEIPSLLQELMRRADWKGQRTSVAWLSRLGNPSAGFVDFIGTDQLLFENHGEDRERFPRSYFGDPRADARRATLCRNADF